MAITTRRLNQSSLEYTSADDIDFDNDLIPIGSAANAGQIAKVNVRLLGEAYTENLGLSPSIKDDPFNAVGDASTNDLVATQAAIDYVGLYPTGVKGSLRVPKGVYVQGGQLKARSDMTIVGEGNDYATLFSWVYSGADIPMVWDGANGSAGFVFRSHLKDMILNFNGWSGSAGECIKFTDVYSCSLTNVSVVECPASKDAILIKPSASAQVNDLVLDRVRIISTNAVSDGIVLDSTNDLITSVKILEPDIELCTRGISVPDAPLYHTVVDVQNPYMEGNDTGIYWGNTNANSNLIVTGGTIYNEDPASVGIEIAADNVTVVGVNIPGGLYSIKLTMTTRPKNVHIIGGSFGAPIYDPNNWLTTNTHRDDTTVWNRKATTRKLSTADNVLLPLFRVYPVYQHVAGPSGAPIAVKVCALVSVKNGNYGSRYQEFWYHLHSDNAGSVYESTLISGTPSVLENANFTVGITPSLTPHATLGYSTFNLTVDTGGALGNGLDYSVWATCEILHDYINTESWVQVL